MVWSVVRSTSDEAAATAVAVAVVLTSTGCSCHVGQRTFIPPAASGCEWLRAVARARTTADDAAAAADGAADAMTGVARTTRRSAIVNAIVFRRDAQKIINRPGVVTDLLNAVLGKSTPATPLQAEACEQ